MNNEEVVLGLINAHPSDIICQIKEKILLLVALTIAICLMAKKIFVR